jgi:hypothetical protein
MERRTRASCACHQGSRTAQGRIGGASNSEQHIQTPIPDPIGKRHCSLASRLLSLASHNWPRRACSPILALHLFVPTRRSYVQYTEISSCFSAYFIHLLVFLSGRGGAHSEAVWDPTSPLPCFPIPPKHNSSISQRSRANLSEALAFGGGASPILPPTIRSCTVLALRFYICIDRA